MKRAMQMFEKTTKLAWESARQGLNYRIHVSNNGVVYGNISVLLHKSNQIGNLLLKDLFTNQKYKLIRDKAKLIFQGEFESLKSLDQVVSYYPDTGLLVYDVANKQLLIHLARESESCEGIVLGNVINGQSVYILQSLRTTETSCDVTIDDAYSFYLKRIINIGLGVSFLLLLNSISFSPKNEVSGLFVRNQNEFECLQK